MRHYKQEHQRDLGLKCQTPTYKKLGVDFDKFYYESDTYLLGKDIVEEGLAKGVFYQKEDKSVWIDLTKDGLDEKLVRRGDGTSVYITQDLGTAQLKYDEFGMDDIDEASFAAVEISATQAFRASHPPSHILSAKSR